MNTTDILIIGGGPAGIVAANNARKHNPNKKITLIRENEKSVIPCGIPYIFHRLDSVEKDTAPDAFLEINNIDLIVGKVAKIDTDNHEIFLENDKKMKFEKLIIATGSKSIKIPIIGIDKKGVWYLKKDFEYLKEFRKAILESKNIVIIGGGFIGVEIAEELSHIKKLNITIVEKLKSCLMTTFDKEFTDAAEEKLKDNNIKICTDTSVEKILGEDKVEAVQLEDKKIPADLVILSIGARPNVDLAQNTSIKFGECKRIQVDEYMETNVKDIFAIGDCAESKCLLTQKPTALMLASTACHEARIASANLYKKDKSINNTGTLSVFSTSVNGLAMGMAGLNERTLKNEGIEIVIGESESPNHHPGSLPNTHKIKTKLIFSRTSGKILGGQIMGPDSVGEMINILALAIQKETTVYDFNTLQIATHPLLTAAPTVYPLILAAQVALSEMNS